MPRSQLEGAIQLASAAVVKRGLIALHARTRASGKNEAMHRDHGEAFKS
jgi:hypothetical protein